MKWIFLLFSLPLFACYVGNPANPAIMNTGVFSASYPFFKFTSGYIGDYVSNKRYADGQNGLQSFGLHSQLATISLILVERLELFGSAGGTKEHANIQDNPTLSSMSEVLLDFQGTYHFCWGAGAKVILLQWGQTFFCSDFTYANIPPSNNATFQYLNRLNLPLVEKQRFNLEEWQISAALASRFYILTPYVGGTYLHSCLNIHDGPQFQNAKNFGLFYGLTLSMTGRFHINFERRVYNEFAYGFSTIAVF